MVTLGVKSKRSSKYLPIRFNQCIELNYYIRKSILFTFIPRKLRNPIHDDVQGALLPTAASLLGVEHVGWNSVARFLLKDVVANLQERLFISDQLEEGLKAKPLDGYWF